MVKDHTLALNSPGQANNNVTLSLPKTFNPGNDITPPIYRDHLLFFENLQRPYECTENGSGIQRAQSRPAYWQGRPL